MLPLNNLCGKEQDICREADVFRLKAEGISTKEILGGQVGMGWIIGMTLGLLVVVFYS